jgi:hypothetical protein
MGAVRFPMSDLEVTAAAFPIAQIVRRRPSVRLQRRLGRTRGTQKSMNEAILNAVRDFGLGSAIIIA